MVKKMKDNNKKIARRFLKKFAHKLTKDNLETLSDTNPNLAKYLKKRAVWSRKILGIK